MSDSKIYMFPDSNHSSDAALWASMARNNDPMATMLAANGGGGFNNMWNNPIWAIVFLAALRNGGIFGDTNNGAGFDTSNQLSAIRE